MNKNIPLRERMIVALDLPSAEEAKAWVDRLGERVGFFKVGLELFLAAGWDMVDYITSKGHKVMLDLKFFDVPVTVRKALARVRDRGVSLVTVHGNDAMLREAVTEQTEDMGILAVTVLTSFGQADLDDMGLTGGVEDLVTMRARRALELGVAGLVCSGLEAQRLRAEFGEKFFIVTPGIRPGANDEVAGDDQVRVMTPGQAIASGADHIVVGRPITGANNPLKVAGNILAEINAAL